ncbi:hypothetical protein EVJ58_g4489 [Rhodofomes roseus]|uniref:F-box domain-containing protein n=1 Tax=Rhodofomes roseus TaxID=34475 RepID=A0A4Y9YFZ1_9APHY|nr:hypothetical protein EVJ58_g4489 [Rhodofomes roseus]
MWRIRRLWTSVAGFYEGNVDLAGRSERRFHSLKKRLDKFLDDIASLRTHIVESPPAVMDDGREALLFLVSPSSVLDNFRAKYKLGYVDLPEILAIPEIMRSMYPGNPKPVFQKLFLTDLPPELLLYIFDIVHIDDARALGVTCRTLYELSFSYVYQRRRLVLHVDPNFIEKTLDDISDIDKRYLCRLSVEMRKRLLRDFRFLLTRDDILKRVEHLGIKNSWTPDMASAAGLNTAFEQQTFYAPIWKEIEATLSGAANLQELQLEKFAMTKEMICAMASLRSLQTLSVHGCPFNRLPSWDTLPPMATVVNLILFPQDVPGSEMLELVALVPNVRSLTVMGLPSMPCALPQDDFIMRHNPFRVLERVNLSHIDDEEVPLLFHWIRDAAITPGQPLRITHFRLELEYGLQEDEVFQLINGLEGAPLRTLTLEGLSYVEDDLFTRLAEAFPDLNALTLIHRQNILQRASRPSRWPGATWEYAARLAAFSCLKHFMWNFDMRPLQCGTTFDLPYAEAGYPASKIPELYREFDENCFEVTWDILPRLFCAYCPTLETLIFSMLHLALLEFKMKRNETGKLVVYMTDEPSNTEQFISNNPIWPINTSFDNPWHIRQRPLRP